MKNTLVIQIRVKMALSAPKRVHNTIACVNRDGLETTVKWILMNVVEVGILYFGKILLTTKELKQELFFMTENVEAEIKNILRAHHNLRVIGESLFLQHFEITVEL